MLHVYRWWTLGRVQAAGVVVGAIVILGSALGASGFLSDLSLVGRLHPSVTEHHVQLDLVAEGFAEAFEAGDETFETVFTAVDGVGANVGDGQRFTRIPRADMRGPGQWALHVPSRATGPNAQACNTCHNQPSDDGAGGTEANVHRDPQHTGQLNRFIQRNTPHLFGGGAVQRLAEEMTDDLDAIRDALIDRVCAGVVGTTRTVPLVSKGIGFGSLNARRTSTGTVCPGNGGRRFTLSTAGVQGVAGDLVVRPFQWKGSVAFIRDFNRDAAHNELGMQGAEMVGDGVDGDGDGIANELTVGDLTALSVYLGAQPRPVTRDELADLGLIPSLTPTEQTAIANGARRFADAACDSCHRPQLELADAVFTEPSQHPAFRDKRFPGGQDPRSVGLDPSTPIEFDLTQDLPDNRIDIGGQTVALGNHISNGNGGAIIMLFGDLKRHDMGQRLAESIDETGSGASTFLTENLWGVASTPPYLHDGRATTLTEAILEHGGEAATSRSRFVSMTTVNQSDLIAFLNNLVLYKPD